MRISPSGRKENKLFARAIEIKNMNSFYFPRDGHRIGEVNRQIALYHTSPSPLPLELIPPGTYRWDADSKQTVLMREKESADDYRYFPEPDLRPARFHGRLYRQDPRRASRTPPQPLQPIRFRFGPHRIRRIYLINEKASVRLFRGGELQILQKSPPALQLDHRRICRPPERKRKNPDRSWHPFPTCR